MDRIDLRSDTVTHPTPKMRHAMMEAPVGDDVFGDDPTVNRLQEMAAQRFGKEAALFVTSGTMGNAVCMLAQCGRGDRAIVGDKSHVHNMEAGNPATLGSIQAYSVPVQPDGTLRLEDIKAAITGDNDHYPVTRLVSIENTHNSMGGQPLSLDYVRQVSELCRRHSLKLHIDGARIFNAAVAMQTDVAEYAAYADSLTFCLSKGLCAPMGSVVVGSAAFIKQARRVRKALGGGLRQAGIVAAAGIVALEEMTERLAEDHANAKALAEGLAQIPGIFVEPERVKTNILFFNLYEDAKLDARMLSDKVLGDNILMYPTGQYRFRAVTHYWIKAEHVELVLKRIKYYMK